MYIWLIYNFMSMYVADNRLPIPAEFVCKIHTHMYKNVNTYMCIHIIYMNVYKYVYTCMYVADTWKATLSSQWLPIPAERECKPGTCMCRNMITCVYVCIHTYFIYIYIYAYICIIYIYIYVYMADNYNACSQSVWLRILAAIVWNVNMHLFMTYTCTYLWMHVLYIHCAYMCVCVRVIICIYIYIYTVCMRE